MAAQAYSPAPWLWFQRWLERLWSSLSTVSRCPCPLAILPLTQATVGHTTTPKFLLVTCMPTPNPVKPLLRGVTKTAAVGPGQHCPAGEGVTNAAGPVLPRPGHSYASPG